MKKLRKKLYPATIEELFNKKIDNFYNQYRNFLSLLRHVYPSSLDFVTRDSFSEMLSKHKYRAIYSHFDKMKLSVNPLNSAPLGFKRIGFEVDWNAI